MAGPTHLRDVTTMTILAGLSALALTVAVAANALVAGRAVDEADGSPDADHWSITAFDSIKSLTGLALVVGWVTTSAWLRRVRRNAELMDPDAPHSRARAWAWWGWLTPIVFLWFPYQLVRDVRRASNADAKPDSLMAVWWGLWVAALLASRLGLLLTDDAMEKGGSVGLVNVVTMLAAVLTLLALVQWILVMRSIVVPQQQRLRDGRLVP